MKNQQYEAALASMSEWLAHPQELGKLPARIEPAGGFDLHGLHYYMFQYKKSIVGKWLLGVCGGYENGGLEHCGHVFSQMKEYNEKTAEQDAIAMVESIREFWMAKAKEAEESQEAADTEGKGNGPGLSFVLLNSYEWDKNRFIRDLKEEWDLEFQQSENVNQEEGILVGTVAGMTATVGYMGSPIPDGEAEYNAAANYLWPDGVKITKTHVAHLLVAVLRQDKDMRDAGMLLVKMCATCLRGKNAIGVYTAGTVFEPKFYREAAEVMRHGELPYLNWIYFGLRQSKEGWMSGYTFGLEAFGKDELEVLDSTATPEELRNFLFNISAYVISSDVVLQDGETLGFSEEERLPITRSEGVNLDGMTLKIGYMPVC